MVHRVRLLTNAGSSRWVQQLKRIDRETAEKNPINDCGMENRLSSFDKHRTIIGRCVFSTRVHLAAAACLCCLLATGHVEWCWKRQQEQQQEQQQQHQQNRKDFSSVLQINRLFFWRTGESSKQQLIYKKIIVTLSWQALVVDGFNVVEMLAVKKISDSRCE